MSQQYLTAFGATRRPIAQEEIYRELWKRGHYDNQAERLLECFEYAKRFSSGFIPTTVLANLFPQYNARIKELRDGKLGAKHKIQAGYRRDNKERIIPGFEYLGKIGGTNKW